MAKDFVIDDRVLRKLERKIAKAAFQVARIGVLQSQGAEVDRDGVSQVEIAAIHEFGAPNANIPERSFIRSTFNTQEEAFKKHAAKLTYMILESGMPIDKALSFLGLWMQAEIKKTITAGAHIPPPLKQETIDRKGSDRPLFDTGRLVQSIHYALNRLE